MAKRTAFLHIGLPHAGGDRIDAALHQHADALAGSGVAVPAKSVDESFRAAVEIRRDHKAWGLRRKDVEGVWSGICRRAYKSKDTVVMGHSLLAGATEAEIDLLVDRLPGFTIHVVVTVAAPDARLSAFPDDHDLADVLRRWDRAVCTPDRMHLVVCDPGAPVPAWEAFGQVVGFEAAGLELPTPLLGEVDTGALRLIAEGTSSLSTQDDLVAVAEEWAKVVADAGYDVRGDLTALVAGVGSAHESDDALRLAVLSEALSDSLAEVTRLRARTRDLERENDKLSKKKRKLKQRLIAVATPA
jgi:hypothetical protein